MNKRIDLKSAVAGLAIGLTIMLATGAATPKPTAIGRFQISGTASHAVVIDTATGQVWSAFLQQNAGKTDGDFWQAKVGEGR
jgi:hypothetical protein